MDGKQNEIVELLWTGGFDSTYRLIQLSKMNVTVRPVYVYGDNRQSEALEREAMKKILAALEKKPNTAARILPIQFINKKNIPDNPEITRAYNTIRTNTDLGIQHEWLGRLAAVRPGLELGHEKEASPSGHHLSRALAEWCCLEPDPDGGYRFIRERSTPEGCLVLGGFRYPVMDKTETDMLADVEQWGYQDVMSLIWFCHTPINGKPCGLCHPCKLKLSSGMERLLPKSAIRRNKIYTGTTKIFGSRIAYRLARHL